MTVETAVKVRAWMSNDIPIYDDAITYSHPNLTYGLAGLCW